MLTVLVSLWSSLEILHLLCVKRVGEIARNFDIVGGLMLVAYLETLNFNFMVVAKWKEMGKRLQMGVGKFKFMCEEKY